MVRSKREFLQLGKEWDGELDLSGWMTSEKLDGMRCLWDGGVTRGLSGVPWNNSSRVSTGLWSRYGNVICAPDWWLDMLPRGVCLDGELWIARGMFEQIISVTRSTVSASDWRLITFHAFDSPRYREIFCDGEIRGVNYSHRFVGYEHWIRNNALVPITEVSEGMTFRKNYQWLGGQAYWNETCHLVKQCDLPLDTSWRSRLEDLLATIIGSNGEGLMVRNPASYWVPYRTGTLLKIKSLYTGVGVVVGYRWGRGKFSGMLGSLIVSWNDVTFEIGGFVDADRGLQGGIGCDGDVCSSCVRSLRFPIGSSVPFEYVGLTDKGIPRSARYHRE